MTPVNYLTQSFTNNESLVSKKRSFADVADEETLTRPEKRRRTDTEAHITAAIAQGIFLTVPEDPPHFTVTDLVPNDESAISSVSSTSFPSPPASVSDKDLVSDPDDQIVASFLVPDSEIDPSTSAAVSSSSSSSSFAVSPHPSLIHTGLKYLTKYGNSFAIQQKLEKIAEVQKLSLNKEANKNILESKISIYYEDFDENHNLRWNNVKDPPKLEEIEDYFKRFPSHILETTCKSLTKAMLSSKRKPIHKRIRYLTPQGNLKVHIEKINKIENVKNLLLNKKDNEETLKKEVVVYHVISKGSRLWRKIIKLTGSKEEILKKGALWGEVEKPPKLEEIETYFHRHPSHILGDTYRSLPDEMFEKEPKKWKSKKLIDKAKARAQNMVTTTQTLKPQNFPTTVPNATFQSTTILAPASLSQTTS